MRRSRVLATVTGLTAAAALALGTTGVLTASASSHQNLASTATTAATVPAATSPQVKVVDVGHAVADLDKTVHFYHDVLGLQVVRYDRRATPDRDVAALTGTRGAKYRTAIIAIPNQTFRLKLTQYSGIAKRAESARHQDPGTPALTLSVKSAVAAFAALKAANTPTLNGQPIPDGTTVPTVFVRDPDGYIVETVQRSGDADYFTVPPPPVTDGPGMKYVVRGQIDLTLWSAKQAVTFYKGILGFDINPGFPGIVEPGEYKPVGFLGGILGVPATALFTAVTGNCDAITRCEYFEYQDPDRVAFVPDIQNPGAPLVTYSTDHLGSLLTAMKLQDIKVVTPGGQPVRVHGHLAVLVRDPSGLLVELLSNH